MIERLRRLRGEAGYNLVEMITVMVIMTVVFAGITTVFVAGSKAQSDQERRFQAQVTTRLALDKIRRVRRMIDAAKPEIELEIDGGVDEATAPQGVQAGARVLVAGSAIFNKHENVAAAMDRLRNSLKANS